MIIFTNRLWNCVYVNTFKNNSNLILLRIKILQKANEMENESQTVLLYDDIMIEMIVYIPHRIFSLSKRWDTCWLRPPPPALVSSLLTTHPLWWRAVIRKVMIGILTLGVSEWVSLTIIHVHEINSAQIIFVHVLIFGNRRNKSIICFLMTDLLVGNIYIHTNGVDGDNLLGLINNKTCSSKVH